MLRLIVPLIAVLTSGLAANVDECSLGESYWCSSLENAKTCGALGHCESTVWQKEILQQDESKACVFCEALIQDFENIVTQSEIEQKIMGNACQMIPSKRKASECQSIVENLAPEIIELVLSDVNSRVICSLLKLCAGLEDKVSHPHLPVSPVNSQLITKLSSQPIQTEPICTDCLNFLTDIKNLLTNKTEEEIEKFADKVCAILGTYEQMCINLVRLYLPEIIQFLKTEFDPKVICHTLGFCAQTMPETEPFLLNLKLMKSDFYSFASAEISAEGCNICKTVMKDLQNLDTDNDFQMETKDFLKTELCERFGNYKIACYSLIDVHGEAVFELLVNERDPESRCRCLGFCAAENMVQNSARKATPSREKASTLVRSGAETPLCDLCKFILKEFDLLLNNSSAAIIAALEKFCGLLPSLIKLQCDLFVQQYGKQFIDLIAKTLDPNVVCPAIKFCLRESF